MKIGVLANEGSWYYRDLARAAEAAGHQCLRLDFERLVARAGRQGESFHSTFGQFSRATTSEVPGNPSEPKSLQSVTMLDAILVRTMPPGSLEQVVFRMDGLARLQAAGLTVVNSPRSLECAVDKYLTTARLQAAGLPVPETIVCEHEDDAMAAFDQLGGDVVVKPLFGAEGRGIVRVSDPDLAHRTFRTIMRLNSVIYVQRFIQHEGYDVRVLVLAGRILGGIRRCSPHDFRTNVSRSAIPQPHTVSAIEEDFALRAAACVEAMIAGVDLLYDRTGNCFVIEVNAVPGWQAFGRITGIDVARCLIDSLRPPG